VTVQALAEAIRRGADRPLHLAPALDAVIPTLLDIVNPGDAVITLGAGSIGTIPKQLVDALDRRGAKR
jgi:UDP-N-acetylmuramate-alanine ligase